MESDERSGARKSAVTSPSASHRSGEGGLPPAAAALPPPPTTMVTMGHANAAAPVPANHISPATPMPPLLAGATSDATPSPAHALAALYQSSRRSRTPRTDAPPRPPGAAAPSRSALPPPPLFVAPPASGSGPTNADAAAAGDDDDEVRQVSLRSSATSSALAFHESWSSSAGSFPASSLPTAPPPGDPRAAPPRPGPGDWGGRSPWRRAREATTPTIPKPSEDAAGSPGSVEPPLRKKMKGADDARCDGGAAFENMEELMGKKASVDAVDTEKDREMGALPSRTREEEGQRGRGGTCPAVARDEAPLPRDRSAGGMQEKERRRRKDQARGRKDRRILRRKVQRLLLIRHCSTCRVPNAPAATGPSASEQCVVCEDAPPGGAHTAPAPGAVCPAMLHCAEGKALCAHIRRCKRADCTYPKCLTSREVLGHYKSCREATCAICGPVREVDRRRRGRGLAAAGGRRRARSESNSSIETIDDEGWLTANMMEESDLVGGARIP